MWSEPKDAAYVHEILERLALIDALMAGADREAFLSHRSAPDALALHFLVLGEAANKLSSAFKRSIPSVEWQKVINLRHLIAHEYRKIDHAELWRIAIEEAPKLKAALPPLPAPGDIL